MQHEVARQVHIQHGPMFRIVGLSPEEQAYIRKTLTVQNPEIARKKRFAGWVSKDIPKTIIGYEDCHESDSSIMVAPGAVKWIWEWLCSRGVRPVYEAPAPFERSQVPYSGQIRPDQTIAFKAILERKMGCVVAPCGGGKTDVAIRALCAIGAKSLILVHTKELLNQWVLRIANRTGSVITDKPLQSVATIGTVVAGKPKYNPSALFIIATVQSLWSQPAILTDLSIHRDLVIVDEAHHTPARTFTEVLARLNPARRYGFTATPDRSDGLTALLHWWLGPVIERIERDQLEAAGLTMRPKLVAHPLRSFFYDFDADEPGDYVRMMKALVEDKDRLHEVARIIQSGWATGYHLVLCQYVELCNALADLWFREPHVALFHGKLTKHERQLAMEAVQSHQTRVLIATTIADEGLDLPWFDTCWLVTPTRSKAKAEQRAGRVCRSAPDKRQPVIHDLVDVNVPTLVSQFKQRLSVWRKIADVNKTNVSEITGGAR